MEWKGNKELGGVDLDKSWSERGQDQWVTDCAHSCQHFYKLDLGIYHVTYSVAYFTLQIMFGFLYSVQTEPFVMLWIKVS